MAGGINSGYQVVVSVVAGQGQEYINTLQSSLNKLAKGVSITPEYNDENIMRLKADLESIAKTQTIRLKLDDKAAIESSKKIAGTLKQTFSDAFSAINSKDFGDSFARAAIELNKVAGVISKSSATVGDFATKIDSTFDAADKKAKTLGRTLETDVKGGIGRLDGKLANLKNLLGTIGTDDFNVEMFDKSAENIGNFVKNISKQLADHPIEFKAQLTKNVVKDLKQQLTGSIQPQFNSGKGAALKIKAKIDISSLEEQIKTINSGGKNKKNGTIIRVNTTQAKKDIDALTASLEKFIKLANTKTAISGGAAALSSYAGLASTLKEIAGMLTAQTNLSENNTSKAKDAGKAVVKAEKDKKAAIINTSDEIAKQNKLLRGAVDKDTAYSKAGQDATNFITSSVNNQGLTDSARDLKANLDAYREKINSLRNDMTQMTPGTEAWDKASAKLKTYQSEADITVAKIKNLTAAQKASDKSTIMLSNTLANMQKYWNQYGSQIQRNSNLLEKYTILQKKLQSGSISAIAAQREFALFKNEAIASGIEAETLTNKMLRSFGTKARSQIAYGGWMLLTTTFRQLYQNILDVDTGMTELKKVTNATREEYADFLTEASERAERLGASLKEVVNISASYARLGYSLQEASNLANTAIVYHNVGDDVNDVDTATEHLISTMQAYNIEADKSMTIADKYNKVSNEFAVSAGDIGTGMQESSAAMEAANNTLDESIALFTAGNTVLQDSSKMGNVLKTTSMRIRGKDCAHYKETYRLPTLNKMAA